LATGSGQLSDLLQGAIHISRHGRTHRLNAYRRIASHGERLVAVLKNQLPRLAPRRDDRWWWCGNS